MAKLEINKYIVADPQICHGKPTFKDTRIMVWQVLELLALGEQPRQIFKSYPTLRPAHIRAALEYASSLTSQPYVVINTFPTEAGVPAR